MSGTVGQVVRVPGVEAPASTGIAGNSAATSFTTDQGTGPVTDMLTRMQVQQARERAAATLEAAGLKLTPEEREGIEVVDFGRNVREEVGAQIVV